MRREDHRNHGPALSRLYREIPFVLIASANARGQMDISPKGDAPGCVRVLDDKTLAIPDRPGNRRADTFTNVLENPRVGLIFFVPGKSETLRVSGGATIVRDADLRGSMSARGKTPDFVLAVDVEEVFFHCSKCIVRSSLWIQQAWPSLDGLPSLAQTMVDAAALPMRVEALKRSSSRMNQNVSTRSKVPPQAFPINQRRPTEIERPYAPVTRLPRHQSGDSRAFYGVGGRYVVEVSTENFR
jgi:uncharacterized protein